MNNEMNVQNSVINTAGQVDGDINEFPNDDIFCFESYDLLEGDVIVKIKSIKRASPIVKKDRKPLNRIKITFESADGRKATNNLLLLKYGKNPLFQIVKSILGNDSLKFKPSDLIDKEILGSFEKYEQNGDEYSKIVSARPVDSEEVVFDEQ